MNETSQRFWIGTNNVGGTGWTNIDGSNVTYFNWASGEPKNVTGNGCVSVDLKGLWYNDDCFTTYPYVCEVPEVGPAPTTTSKTTVPTTPTVAETTEEELYSTSSYYVD